MNNRELQILNILFSTNKPMMITEIMWYQELTQSTVAAVIRKLLKKGYVEISGYRRSGKVLGREYIPTLKAKEAIKEYFCSVYKPCEAIISLDELFQHIKDKSN